jgi:superfamily I DNA/RNA helicase
MPEQEQTTDLNDGEFVLFRHKDFDSSLHKLFKLGGQNRKRFEKASGIVEAIGHGGLADLKKFPITNHGESRIRSCVKFDLGDGFRLITQQANKCVVLLFVGNHDACEDWLNRNRGLEVVFDAEAGTLRPIFKSAPEQGVVLSPPPKPSGGPLLEKLSASRVDELLEGVPARTVMKLSQLSGTVTANEIQGICEDISAANRMNLIQDVMCHLAADDVENAELRLDEFFGRTKTIESSEVSEVLAVKDGDTIRRLVVGSNEYDEWLKRFSLEGDHLEWMLFMHPEQERIVDEDFEGTSQLSGVSGSGKTCIAVRRALRLAKSSEGEKILLVTLNRSLAGLISKLVDAAADSESIRSRVKVTSFFELCQELLAEFEPKRVHYYDAVSWKLNEHIDEVFREYYRCWTNSRTADVLVPIHQSLCAQSINSEAYLREEFDWIRTALSPNSRLEYTNPKKTQRLGRTHPIQEEWRRAILKGLDGWEQKMEAVGVIDYLGLTTALLRHKDKLSNRFSRVVIDEAQDFGTMELSILRQLVPAGPNDIFLCGDIAQHILPKHRVLPEAGIDIGGRRRRIQRNYRNTRQILEAAYHVLYQNLHDEMLDRPEKDLEILDPKYANRSSNEPLVLKAGSLEEEIGYARTVVSSHLKQHPNANCCIALAGYSTCEVERFAKKLGLRALDGSGGFLHEKLVLSDLEQTKGYEFDLVVIVNCCKGVLPPHDTPADEMYRDGCRLYVAMTRAKNDLYLSYHGEPSPWLQSASEKLSFFEWDEVEELDTDFHTQAPEKIPELEESDHSEIGALSGEQYCYTGYALGLSHEAQDKLRELVDGRGMTRDRQRVKWRSVADLKRDLESSPRVRGMFGPKTSLELRGNLKAIPD